MIERETLAPVSPTHIIVDGAMLYAGHRWAWRRGVVIGTGAHGFVRVRLEATWAGAEAS